MTTYALVKRLPSEIVVLTTPEFGQNMWTLARLRKPRECESCRLPLATGSMAYRPITNGSNRCHRLCKVCAR